MDGGELFTSCSLHHAWHFADHDKNNLISKVTVTVSVFFFCSCTDAKFSLIVLKGVHIKANFCQDENVLGVRRTSQKFWLFVYFSCNTVLNKGYMKF